MKPRLFLLHFVAQLWFFLATAQDQKVVSLVKYTQSEGLSSYFITKLFKDSYGFIWIGTQEGLNLFDGRDFTIFNKRSVPTRRIAGSFIADIVEDTTRSLLWVATSYGDVTAIDLPTRCVKKTISLDPTGVPLSQKWLRCLALQGDTLWMGGLDVLYAYSISQNKYISINLVAKFFLKPGSCNVAKIGIDYLGRVWLFSDESGITVLDKRLDTIFSTTAQALNTRENLRKFRVWNIFFNGADIYVGTSWGLRRFASTKQRILASGEPFHPIADTSEVFSLTGDSEKLFLTTPGGLYMHQYSSRSFTAFLDGSPNDNWLASTFQLLHDSDENLMWIGSQAGLARFSVKQEPFDRFVQSSTSGTRILHAYSLLPVNDSILYCGDESGIFRVNIKTKGIQRIGTTKTNLLLFKNLNGLVFVSNKSGFFFVDRNRLHPVSKIFPVLKPLEKDQLSAAIQFNDSIVVFSSVIQKGLSVWNTAAKTLKIYHKDSSHSTIQGLAVINYLFLDENRQLFILTEKSIIKFSPLTGSYETYVIKDPRDGLPFSNFMDMTQAEDGYWVATYGDGLLKVDKSFHLKGAYSTSNGLSNDCVYRVFAIDQSLIVLTTNNGLTVLDVKKQGVSRYYHEDGLHSNSFEQLCGYLADSFIYAGGVNGFTRIELEKLRNSRPVPKMYIHTLRLRQRDNTYLDTSNLKFVRFEVPSNTLDLGIYFTAVNFKSPRRISYEYKLVGLQNDWISGSAEGFINLIGVQPGDYLLYVRAVTDDGTTTEAASLLLRFLPKWYQTWWFKIAILLAGLGIVFALYYYRVNQLKIQQQIRRNIASDLHDDIGSNLNAVKMYTYLATKEFNNQPYLLQIEDSLLQISTSLRDIIWVLDESGDTLFDLMERIKKFANPLAAANNILLECTIEGADLSKQISKTEKRNLLLIAREAINNSIKYSECKSIKVVLEFRNSKIRLRVHDDGVGFDVTSVTPGSGLKNIRYRASQIRYHLTISSLNGTLIQVEALK